MEMDGLLGRTSPGHLAGISEDPETPPRSYVSQPSPASTPLSSPYWNGASPQKQRSNKTYDITSQVRWKTLEVESQRFTMLENLDSLAYTEKGDALVHVTSFGLMLQSLESDLSSRFFQLQTISRFHTADNTFVFEAMNQDTGHLNMHILDASAIAARALEAAVATAIEVKMEELNIEKQWTNKPKPHRRRANTLITTKEPYWEASQGGVSAFESITEFFNSLGTFFSRPRRRSSTNSLGRPRQISL